MPSTGAWVTEGGSAAEIAAIGGAFLFSLRMPVVQTQYLSANSQTVSFSAYLQFVSCDCGGQSDAGRMLRPGQRLTENWGRYPLSPQPTVSLLRGRSASQFPVVPSALRRGNTLELAAIAFTDNQFGHVGSGLFGGLGKVTGTYAIQQDGATLARGSAVNGIPASGSARSHRRVRLTLNTDWNSPSYPLSAVSATTWTWRSVRRPHASLPAGWYCERARYGRLMRVCAVQPLLTLRYQVRGLALDGTAPPGRQEIGLTASHLQLAQAAPVSRVTVQVSFDSGKSWHPATVTPAGPGRFRLGFTAPAGSGVTLRVSAANRAGDSISQTITRGYRVGPAAATMAVSHSLPGHLALRAACPPAPAGVMVCQAFYRPQRGALSRPHGLTPAQIESAYRLRVSRRTSQTVAVSIAYNTPHLAAYLARYRRYFGLPPCTTASGCLRIVNQQGQARPLPRSGLHTGWDLEATLDVSMISAACPHCKILVMEGDNPGTAPMAATERTAARLSAQVISNSYGQRENGAAFAYRQAYHQPGHTVVVAAGDFGFTAAAFPADLTSVTAVGGTQLSQAPRNSRGWSERVWNTGSGAAGGSGCSAYVSKPSWQHDRHCHGRTVVDVAAVAANVPVYDQAWGGWITVAGTSVAAPLIAGIYGLASNAATTPVGYAYRHARDLFDITRGSNAVSGPPGKACGDDYLCVAKKGYDAPTGLGTPDGIGAF